MHTEYVCLLLGKTSGHPRAWPLRIVGPFDDYDEAVAFVERSKKLDSTGDKHREWYISELEGIRDNG